MMKEKLMLIVESATKEAKAIKNDADYLNIKSKYLGKKSELNNLLSDLKNMNAKDKKTYGPLLNKMKVDLEKIFHNYYEEAINKTEGIFDWSLPVEEKKGSLHPLTIVTQDITNILKTLGFKVILGPEMESGYYNFDALNFSPTHPARDMYDTYWLDNELLLRCHTSPVQVRALQKYGAPIKICVPGRCFRNEDIDASHENTFFQLEGMVVDKNISISNMLYIMQGMLEAMFERKIKVRLRPGYFPFVEPGFELDCSCMICDGEGCPTCKGSGWIELLPCGMIHPNVLSECGIDPKIYSGFAFGMGLTRLVMMRYKINDIRVLNAGDLRILEEFNVR